MHEVKKHKKRFSSWPP